MYMHIPSVYMYTCMYSHMDDHYYTQKNRHVRQQCVQIRLYGGPPVYSHIIHTWSSLNSPNH